MGLSAKTDLSRRALFAGTSCVMAALALPARAAFGAAGTGGIVAMDWVSGMNLMALGAAPIAMPELERYARLVVEPALTGSTHELGLRSEPNIELVDRLKPDLIVMGNEFGLISERLAAIAPVQLFNPDGFGDATGKGPIERGRLALQALAERIGTVEGCERFNASLEQEIAAARARLAGYDGRPLILATIIDGRRLLVFGRNSLFQDVLDRLGIENAWTGPVSRYGHVTVNADRLVDHADARLLCIGDSSSKALDALLAGPVIASLPFVRERRIAGIADVLFYGGLPPARRFALLASTALAGEG